MTPAKPNADPVKESVDAVEQSICAAPGDLMRLTEAEPDPGAPRDPLKGYQPDELVAHIQALAEWGARGWQRVLDWQEREKELGPCTRLPQGQ